MIRFLKILIEHILHLCFAIIIIAAVFSSFYWFTMLLIWLASIHFSLPVILIFYMIAIGTTIIEFIYGR